MKQKFLLLILSLAVSIGYSQAQEITNVRQDGDKLILDYELPSKMKSVKFYYKYQSQNKSNLIGEAKKLPAGNGSYVWDLSETNTVLTGENLSFALDGERLSTDILVMASHVDVYAGTPLKVGLLFNNHGFYIAPVISLDGADPGVSAGYIGKHNRFGWYAGLGYYNYDYDYSSGDRTYIEAGIMYYIANKIPVSIGVSYDDDDDLFPQLGIGYLF